MSKAKVLLLEFNEITWSLIDPLIDQGKLPNLARLKREGTWAAPMSNDLPPYLNPWITWVTVHTGVDQRVHGANLLEQAVDTISAKRSWEYVAEAGLSIGVFGSMGAFPPRPVRGFWVPGPFAPASETFPQELRPIHDLNRKYTQAYNRVGSQDSVLDMARQAYQLVQLGLQPATIARIAWQLGRERVQRHLAWKRVSLQPFMNFDFFTSLYRRLQPDYATWHTNHVAHYMHHYWRSMDDVPFLTRATPEEQQYFGRAIPYGYVTADQLLGRFMRLVDQDTVLVLASSMGQQPYVSEEFPAGRITVRARDIHQILRIVGARGVTAVAPAMAQQWNLTIPDEIERARLKHVFLSAYNTGARREMFSIAEMGDILRISPCGIAQHEPGVRVFFPGSPEADAHGYAFDDLFAAADPTPKEGIHHPRGVLVLWGKDIRRGVEIPATTNLDIAPTMLTLLGVPVPSIMQGRVLSEAWGETPTVPAVPEEAHQSPVALGQA